MKLVRLRSLRLRVKHVSPIFSKHKLIRRYSDFELKNFYRIDDRGFVYRKYQRYEKILKPFFARVQIHILYCLLLISLYDISLYANSAIYPVIFMLYKIYP